MNVTFAFRMKNFNFEFQLNSNDNFLKINFRLSFYYTKAKQSRTAER